MRGDTACQPVTGLAHRRRRGVFTIRLPRAPGWPPPRHRHHAARLGRALHDRDLFVLLRESMALNLKVCWNLVKLVANAWLDNYAPSMGAALAYYTMFSLAPLMLIVISVAGLVFGEEAARGEIQAQLTSLMGAQGARAVQDLLTSVPQRGEGAAATVLGVLLLFVGATTVFGELQDALDRIWQVAARGSTSAWLSLLRARLLSFGMILAIGFLLMVSLIGSATLAALGRHWEPVFGGWYGLATAAGEFGAFVLAAVLFALIYKLMPRVQVQWRDVWIGALFTALLFTLGKVLIGLYVARSDVVSAFGAAGSLVVVLLWVYYSAQIFLIGATFTWVYANAFGSRRAVATPVQPDGGVAPAASLPNSQHR